MIVYTLNVNIALYAKEIENNYLKVRDMCYRSVLGGLLVNTEHLSQLTESIIVDDSYYNSLLRNNVLLYQKASVFEVFNNLGIAEIANFFTDIELYLTPFLARVLDGGVYILNCEVDENYHLVVRVKKLKRLEVKCA